MTITSNIRDADADKFDQVLKKLETTKQHKQQHRQKQQYRRHRPSSSTMTESRHYSDSSDNSSSNGNAFGYDCGFAGGDGERDDERTSDNSTSESKIFETRQSFVDRRAGGTITPNFVNSFIERAQSAERCGISDGGEVESRGERDAMFVEEGLPDAILKVRSVFLPLSKKYLPTMTMSDSKIIRMHHSPNRQA